MKKFFLINLLVVFIAGTFSFGSENQSDNSTTLSEGIWKLTKFTVDEEDRTNTLDECDLRDTFKFTDDGKFTNKSFVKNTKSGNCDSETTLTGTWIKNGKVNDNERFIATYFIDLENPIILLLGKYNLTYSERVEQKNGSFKEYRYEYKKQ